MGFAGYFLIVADFINLAKGRASVGPGRLGGGEPRPPTRSASPISTRAVHLLFERFLNPGRRSMPTSTSTSATSAATR